MRFAIVFCLLLLGLLSAGAFAQTSASSSDYVIGVDDVIVVSVISHEGMDKELTVLPDGTVSYPQVVGTIKAAGKTLDKLAAEIKTALEKTLNNVMVTVTVKEVRSRKVTISGPVKSSGAYNLKANWRILDVIVMAGGLTARPASVTGKVVHSNQTTEAFSMVEAILKPASEANPVLAPNDMIILEERDSVLDKVSVMGKVNKPGAYPVGEEGSNIMAILSQAGNTTEDAALTRVSVMRGTEVIALNLEPIVLHGQMTDELRKFQLKAGDVLFVPEIEQRISIMGQVNKPGNYALPETKKITALEALSMAGGQTQNGDIGKAGIVRTVAGKATVIELNIDKMMNSKNLAANIPLQTGDVLYIPVKGQKSTFNLLSLLTPLSWLFLKR